MWKAAQRASGSRRADAPPGLNVRAHRLASEAVRALPVLLAVFNVRQHPNYVAREARVGVFRSKAGRNQLSIFAWLDLVRDPHSVGEGDHRKRIPQRFAHHLAVRLGERCVHEHVGVTIELSHFGERVLPGEMHARSDAQPLRERHESVVIGAIAHERE